MNERRENEWNQQPGEGSGMDSSSGAAGGGQQWQQQQPPPGGWGTPAEQKSVGLAAVLSMLPGLGQIYTGFYQRGFVHMAVVAVTITLLNEWRLSALHPLLGIFLPFFWIYNMIDAARCAQAVNRALRGGKPLDLPDPPLGIVPGSKASGIVLVVVGVLLLGVTAFELDLRWLREWWPLLLIVFGVRLILQDRSRR